MEYETGTPEGPEPEDAVSPELQAAWDEADAPEMVDVEPEMPAEDPLNRMLTMLEGINQRLVEVERGQEEVKILAAREPELAVDYSEFIEKVVGPPEGKRRFASRYSEGTYIKTPSGRMVIDGQVINTPQIDITFSGGVVDLDEQTQADLIEWALNHPDFNKSFWEDPTAVRVHSTVELSQGVRDSTVPAPRTGGLSAPMQ